MAKTLERRLCLKVTFISGVVLTLFGTALLLGNELMFDLILNRELALSPGSSSYEVWQETPIPMNIDFYFFNWTNPKELGSEKPSFVEMGPYRFSERHKKVNITWNDNNDTVSYRRVRYWFFDEENSNGTLSDEVTTLNAVALTAAVTVRDWNYIMKKSLSMGLSRTSQTLSITRPVRELLFEGYSDSLLDLARKMQMFGGVNVPFDKFGWFYTRNGSETFDGYFNMATGKNNINQLGKLGQWNYDNVTTFYEDQCSEVRGSSGEFWPPNRSKAEPLTMFSPDLCRSIAFQYKEEILHHGVKGLKYVMDESIVDNGTVNPENECYCNGRCSPVGVINVTTCRYGAPAFVSYPHFFLADKFYSDAVEGMRPDEHKHQFYINIEPRTGIPLEVAARLQINLLLQPINHVILYQNVPEIYFPMFWFNQRIASTADMATTLGFLLKVPTIATYSALVLLALGCAFFALSLAGFFSKSNEQFKKNIKVVHLDKKDRMFEMPVRQPLISYSCDMNKTPLTSPIET